MDTHRVAAYTTRRVINEGDVAAVDASVDAAVVDGQGLIRVQVDHVKTDGRSVQVGRRVLRATDERGLTLLIGSPLAELRPLNTEATVLRPFDREAGAKWTASPSCALTWWLRLRIFQAVAALKDAGRGGGRRGR